MRMSERKGLILSLLEEHDYEAVIKLLDANPSVAHNTYNGITTLALALKNEKTTLKLIEIAPELILYKDSSGNLPIHIACRNSHVKVILKLLELQPETIYERNKAGCHCLHYVVQRINEKEILKLIIQVLYVMNS
jgi:ankyrin repeat protein